MKQRPILFSAPMVRALLDGSKTQTRRIVKHKGELPPEWATFAGRLGDAICDRDLFRWSEEQTPGQPLKPLRRWPYCGSDPVNDWHAIRCPIGDVGDQLWVREAFADVGCRLTYKADENDGAHCQVKRWTPSIYMPREASRITIAITGIRVELLHDIREQDAIAEGATGGHGAIPNYQYAATPLEHFKHIWESINGADSWEANPWVWVIKFKRVEQ